MVPASPHRVADSPVVESTGTHNMGDTTVRGYGKRGLRVSGQGLRNRVRATSTNGCVP